MLKKQRLLDLEVVLEMQRTYNQITWKTDND
jgi:hypothetical protein